MEFFFVGLATIIASGFLSVGWILLRRAMRIRKAWHGGRTSEARCLQVFTTRSSGDTPTTHQHRVYEFTTREGRTVRISESGGRETVLEGDTVMVRYSADEPEHATAQPYRPVALAVGMGFVVAFVAVAVTGCCVMIYAALTWSTPELEPDQPTGVYYTEGLPF
ncbi:MULTISPECIES: DUF3592 domain-containing protein [unclassified Streptomyces]|uniref:DUF3592 domain-containing protein n=1 Tax=unclassified Streptomyces TaxID=2593676 RepID=UPI0003733B7E|nr:MULTISPECIES: DUF3592 domain-containing protein [unclassified Streptomyces]